MAGCKAPSFRPLQGLVGAEESQAATPDVKHVLPPLRAVRQFIIVRTIKDAKSKSNLMKSNLNMMYFDCFQLALSFRCSAPTAWTHVVTVLLRFLL